MARRSIQLFNLSFLDVLSAALGAVIFLFIITPKGGQSPSIFSPIAVSIDTLHRQVFGSLGDEFYHKQAGDTLLVVIKNYEELPSLADCPECPTPIECPECPPPIICPELPEQDKPLAIKQPATSITKGVLVKTKPPVTPPIVKTPKHIPEDKLPVSPKETNSTYSGDAPNVPCSVSFEIRWDNLKDNVDLSVCKGKSCVYGRKRSIKTIGQWDSGKSKNKFPRNDLRTTQEAVRQFGKIIPGKYELYAQFKESEQNKQSVNIKGLIYSKNDKKVEQGEPFYKLLMLNEKKRTHIGTVVLQENGQFKFTKK